MTKLTATHQGVTATRETKRSYTHVIFALYSPAYYIGHYEREAASPTATPEWAARCRTAADELRAKGDAWRAISWHQGEANAQKGLAAAAKTPSYLQLALVEVSR